MTSTQTLTEVKIVDTDVHPLPRTLEELAAYVPHERWRQDLFPTDGRTTYPNWHYYDIADAFLGNGMRMDSVPPRGGLQGSDPDFAVQQLFVEAGVDIGILEPMVYCQWPEREHALAQTHNAWLADVWLGEHNRHGRWRGSICVSPQAPEAAAREIERWAGHPYFVQVLIQPQTYGIAFGDPRLDPIFATAARHGLPVATHLAPQGPSDQTPFFPMGMPAHWHDFFACWPLLLISHLSSLVFDGAFERNPDLKIVFVESGFTWAAPTIWRLDRAYEARKQDLPHLKRKPSEYIREHVFWATQPMEEVETSEFRRYMDVVDMGKNIMFSTDYPHWSFDSPSWAMTRFPKDQRDDIMRGNAMRLYNLPSSVPALPARVTS